MASVADRSAASCRRLVKVYRTSGSEVHALRGVDARFLPGAVTAVVGPSGSGKSSLLRILAGLDRPTAGQVRIGEVDLTDLPAGRLRKLRRDRVGYVFQRPADNLIPHLRVDDHLAQALRLRGGTAQEADRICAQLGISHRLSHRPAELSGGEQQRVAFVQAALGQPALLLADEPTAELDSGTGHDLMEAVTALARAGTAVVVSTHDHAVVEVADMTLALRHGAVESETRLEQSLAVIDEGGRVQLPEEALAQFPDGRARLEVTDQGVWLRPPADGQGT